MKEKIELYTKKIKSSLSSINLRSKNFANTRNAKLTTDYSSKNQRSINLKRWIERIKNLNFKRFIKSPLFILGISLVVVFAASIAMAWTIVGRTGDDRITPPKAIASQELNTRFQFPIRDAENVEVAKVTYEIEKASLQNSFIYQGKLAKSVKGRTFLVFDLKITNPFEKGIEINTIDYIRIKRNGDEEQLAPEIHNDPVQIQANSTKYTRIGIPINETDKDLIILVGELKGDKKEVKLNF